MAPAGAVRKESLTTASPATVRALVEALEAAVQDMENARDSTGMGTDAPLEQARAALARAKAEGLA